MSEDNFVCSHCGSSDIKVYNGEICFCRVCDEFRNYEYGLRAYAIYFEVHVDAINDEEAVRKAVELAKIKLTAEHVSDIEEL